jgi:hypothetical protein
MSRISAANNLTIDVQPERWLLLAANGADERTLLEAVRGEPLRYAAPFAERRRLPENGQLPPEQIQRVVLGWSESDAAWHLGLLLSPDLAQERGSRWCEVARWGDLSAGQYGGAAVEAGEQLARAISRPFNVVPPKNGAVPSSTAETSVHLGAPATVRTAAVAAPTVRSTYDAPVTVKTKVALPEPPFTTGLWTLDNAPDGTLRYKRSSVWVRARLMRAGWYALWCGVYIFLSLATLNSSLALPNAGTMLPSPEILPYLGIASAVLLFGLVIYVLFDTLTSPGEIVIDPTTRTLSVMNGDDAVWSEQAHNLSGLYVTQIIHHRRNKASVEYGELNLFYGEKKFRRFLRFEPLDEPFTRRTDPITGELLDPSEEEVAPLSIEHAVTPLQRAALVIAAALDLPCYYDQRLK